VWQNVTLIVWHFLLIAVSILGVKVISNKNSVTEPKAIEFVFVYLKMIPLQKIQINLRDVSPICGVRGGEKLEMLSVNSRFIV